MGKLDLIDLRAVARECYAIYANSRWFFNSITLARSMYGYMNPPRGEWESRERLDSQRVRLATACRKLFRLLRNGDVLATDHSESVASALAVLCQKIRRLVVIKNVSNDEFPIYHAYFSSETDLSERRRSLTSNAKQLEIQAQDYGKGLWRCRSEIETVIAEVMNIILPKGQQFVGEIGEQKAYRDLDMETLEKTGEQAISKSLESLSESIFKAQGDLEDWLEQTDEEQLFYERSIVQQWLGQQEIPERATPLPASPKTDPVTAFEAPREVLVHFARAHKRRKVIEFMWSRGEVTAAEIHAAVWETNGESIKLDDVDSLIYRIRSEQLLDIESLCNRVEIEPLGGRRYRLKHDWANLLPGRR